MWGYEPYGMMGGYSGGFGGGFGMLLGGVFLILLLAIIVVVFIALVRGHNHSHAAHWMMTRTHGLAGLEALDERYARGEINREEYQQKKKDILNGRV